MIEGSASRGIVAGPLKRNGTKIVNGMFTSHDLWRARRGGIFHPEGINCFAVLASSRSLASRRLGTDIINIIIIFLVAYFSSWSVLCTLITYDSLLSHPVVDSTAITATAISLHIAYSFKNDDR